MQRRGLVTFSLGVSAGMAAYAGLASGLLGDAAGALAGAGHALVAAPPAAAAELPRFEHCEELRRWYVRAALREVGPWGLDGSRVVLAAPTAAEGATSRSAADQVVGTSGTGTNVQDRDVDEADVAKTDGRILARVTGRTLVVTDVSGGRPRELSSTTLPGAPVVGAELLLRGSRILVVATEASVAHRGFPGPGPGPGGEGEIARDLPGDFLPPVQRDTRTRLVSFDVSDPSAPRLTDDRRVSGGAVSTRQYADGTVRVVLSTGAPQLRFVHPDRDRSPAEATRENRRIVQAAPLSSWLPQVRTSSGEPRPLVDCSDVRHPLRPSGLGTVSVLSFPLDHADRFSATAVTTSGDLAYSSTDRLYVATTHGRSTAVHGFALDETRTRYVGSGSVTGIVKDRWSLDEYDGRLRVAATTDPGFAADTPTTSTRAPLRSSTVTVLEERDGRLVQVGRVEGLGVGEDIKAVRWLGALAVVVTFETTDPLYTVDLSEPARPRVVGELKAPGYSAYLHPVGGGLLVGIGRDATWSGMDRGAQAAAFDLRDLADVRRSDTLSLGRDSEVGAEFDARAFAYLPDRRTLVVPVWSWQTGRSRFVAVHVSGTGQLSETGSWASGRYLGTAARTLPLGGDRVALVDDEVRLVHVG